MKETGRKKHRTLKAMKQARTKPPRPLRADAQRNRRQLLDAAQDVFTAEGPEASLEEIARRAGVGIATLYRNFPTRYDLIEAMYAGRMENLIDLARRLSQTLPPGEALFAWLRAEAQHMVTFRPLKIFLMSDAAGKKPDPRNWKEAIHDVMGRLLEEARSAGEIRGDVDVSQVMQLVHAVIIASENSGPRSVGEMLEVVIDGLRPPQA